MQKLTLNNATNVIEQIQLDFKKLHEGDFLLRLYAISLIALGWNCAAVAQLFRKSV